MSRVIAGELRGRRLHTPSDSRIRPTTDRVKTVLFDLLGPLTGLDRALDLFAGTGALGIEALSRGVLEVTFVEHDRAALALLARNLDDLGLSARAQVRRIEVFRYLRRASDRWPLIFADPPYGTGDGNRLLRSAGPLVAEGGRLAIEHPPAEPVGGAKGLELTKSRKLGGTVLSIFRRVVDDGGRRTTREET